MKNQEVYFTLLIPFPFVLMTQALSLSFLKQTDLKGFFKKRAVFNYKQLIHPGVSLVIQTQ